MRVLHAALAVFVGDKPGHTELAAGDYLVAGSVTRLPVIQLDGTGSASIPIPLTQALLDSEVYPDVADLLHVRRPQEASGGTFRP